MKKRILSIVLAFALCFTLIPTSFAIDLRSTALSAKDQRASQLDAATDAQLQLLTEAKDAFDAKVALGVSDDFWQNILYNATAPVITPEILADDNIWRFKQLSNLADHPIEVVAQAGSEDDAASINAILDGIVEDYIEESAIADNKVTASYFDTYASIMTDLYEVFYGDVYVPVTSNDALDFQMKNLADEWSVDAVIVDPNNTDDQANAVEDIVFDLAVLALKPVFAPTSAEFKAALRELDSPEKKRLAALIAGEDLIDTLNTLLDNSSSIINDVKAFAGTTEAKEAVLSAFTSHASTLFSTDKEASIDEAYEVAKELLDILAAEDFSTAVLNAAEARGYQYTPALIAGNAAFKALDDNFKNEIITSNLAIAQVMRLKDSDVEVNELVVTPDKSNADVFTIGAGVRSYEVDILSYVTPALWDGDTLTDDILSFEQGYLVFNADNADIDKTYTLTFYKGIDDVTEDDAYRYLKSYDVTFVEEVVVDTIEITSPLDGATFAPGDEVVVQGTTNLPLVNVAVYPVDGDALTDSILYQTVTNSVFTGEGLTFNIPENAAEGDYYVYAGVSRTSDVVEITVESPFVPFVELDNLAITQYNLGDSFTVKGESNLDFISLAITNPNGLTVFYQTLTNAEFEEGIEITIPEDEPTKFFVANGYTIIAGITDVSDSLTFDIIDGEPFVPYVTLDEIADTEYELGDSFTVKGATNLEFINLAITNPDGETVFYQTVTKAEFEAGIEITIPEDDDNFSIADGYTLIAGITGTFDTFTFDVIDTVPDVSKHIVSIDVDPATLVVLYNSEVDLAQLVTVTATLADGSTIELETVWGTYDKTVAADHVVNGTVTIPDGYTLDSSLSNTVSVTVTVLPADTEVIYVDDISIDDVEYKTPFNRLNLPATITGINSETGDDVVLDIVWDADSYDKNVSGAKTVIGTIVGNAVYAYESGLITTTIVANFNMAANATFKISGATKMTVNNYKQLQAVVEPSSADLISIVWESSDESLATVSETGRVKAKKVGTVTITATATIVDQYGTEIVIVDTHNIKISKSSSTGDSTSSITPGGVIIPPVVIKEFPDLNGHWSEDTVRKMVEQGYIQGYEDGTFRPDGMITRAEFGVIVGRILGVQENSEGIIYRDTVNHWARDMIAAMSLPQFNGILRGYNDILFEGDTGTFGPDDPVTREQAVAIIVRAKQWAAIEGATGAEKFADAADISWFFENDMNIAVNHGLLNGYPDGTYKPLNNTTRAEACELIFKAFNMN